MSGLLDMPIAQNRQVSGMSRLDELNRILRKLQIDSPGIETSAPRGRSEDRPRR